MRRAVAQSTERTLTDLSRSGQRAKYHSPGSGAKKKHSVLYFIVLKNFILGSFSKSKNLEETVSEREI